MSDLLALKKDIINQFGTPCAVVDLNILEKNITRVQKICDKAGVSNRPHIKTHKSCEICLLYTSDAADDQ